MPVDPAVRAMPPGSIGRAVILFGGPGAPAAPPESEGAPPAFALGLLFILVRLSGALLRPRPAVQP